MFDNTMWTNAEIADDTPQFTELTDGNYDVVIDSISMREPQTTKTGYQLPSFLVINYTVLTDGPYYGKWSRIENGFWNEQSASFIKRDVIRLGCTIPKNYLDLPIALQSAVGKTINITVKNKPRNDGKGTLTSTYINKVVDLIVPPTIQKSRERNEISSENAKRLANITKVDNQFVDNISDDEIPF